MSLFTDTGLSIPLPQTHPKASDVELLTQGSRKTDLVDSVDDEEHLQLPDPHLLQQLRTALVPPVLYRRANQKRLYAFRRHGYPSHGAVQKGRKYRRRPRRVPPATHTIRSLLSTLGPLKMTAPSQPGGTSSTRWSTTSAFFNPSMRNPVYFGTSGTLRKPERISALMRSDRPSPARRRLRKTTTMQIAKILEIRENYRRLGVSNELGESRRSMSTLHTGFAVQGVLLMRSPNLLVQGNYPSSASDGGRHEQDGRLGSMHILRHSRFHHFERLLSPFLIFIALFRPLRSLSRLSISLQISLFLISLSTYTLHTYLHAPFGLRPPFRFDFLKGYRYGFLLLLAVVQSTGGVAQSPLNSTGKNSDQTYWIEGALARDSENQMLCEDTQSTQNRSEGRNQGTLIDYYDVVPCNSVKGRFDNHHCQSDYGRLLIDIALVSDIDIGRSYLFAIVPAYAPGSMVPHLSEFPTELLEEILRLATDAPNPLACSVQDFPGLRRDPARAREPYQKYRSSLATKLAVCGVSRQWNALGTPHLYERIVIADPARNHEKRRNQLHALLRTFTEDVPESIGGVSTAQGQPGWRRWQGCVPTFRRCGSYTAGGSVHPSTAAIARGRDHYQKSNKHA
ncbi:hypothetical protein NMY22_g19089 [Coprinellus aureogranulatus]|nr:hypothetical protein NMY22_g19089 [Coprinellus aureogranulatus]